MKSSQCLLYTQRLQNIRLDQPKLITGIADMLQVYSRYALDIKKR